MNDQPPPAYVSSRRIGAADVTVISEGSCLWAPKLSAPETEWRRAMPEADAEGRIPIGFNVAYLRLGGASIVIDPGFDGPRSAWQQRFAAYSPNLPALVRTAGLDTALARLGVAPGDVTHVLITHTHADHFAGVTAEQDGRQRARFPHARHILSLTPTPGASTRIGDWTATVAEAQGQRITRMIFAKIPKRDNDSPAGTSPNGAQAPESPPSNAAATPEPAQ